MGTVVYISRSGFKGTENTLKVAFFLGHKGNLYIYIYIYRTMETDQDNIRNEDFLRDSPIKIDAEVFRGGEREFEIVLQSGT